MQDPRDATDGYVPDHVRLVNREPIPVRIENGFAFGVQMALGFLVVNIALIVLLVLLLAT